MRVGKGFLLRTPCAQELRPTTGKWDFIKLKSFCAAKEKKTQSSEEEWRESLRAIDWTEN